LAGTAKRGGICEGGIAEATGVTCPKIMGFNPMRDRSFRDDRQSQQPLRQRMIEDMTARRFTEKVQKDYMRAPMGSWVLINQALGLFHGN
jgi:hypothetical protein